ncbi:MAG: hypothetical protein ACO1N2_00835 [Candidatus Saccharimonadota bacterium]
MTENEGVAQAAHLQRIEAEGTPEQVHGEFEPVRLYASQFIKLAQIRPGENGVLDELKDSIERRGKALNPIDCARLDAETLSEYIAFTNKVWGANKTIEDFAEQNIDGYYYLVCAGHSRHEAITQLETEGRIPTYRMLGKVHPIESVQDILDIQYDENIHSKPPVERSSFVSVESYLWGLERGDWSSVQEFAEARGLTRQKTGMLVDGILFVHLPPTFREFVFKKKMSYTAGIELARTGEVLKESIAHKVLGASYDSVEDEELKAEIDEQIMRELVIKTNTITRGRLNSTASVKLLKAWQQELRASLRTKEEQDEAAAQETNLGLFEIMATPREMLAEMRRASQEQINEFMRQYGRTPSSSAYELLQLNSAFVDPALMQEVHDDFVQSAKSAARQVGNTSLRSLAIVDERLEATA